jgi:hypothetical protein
MRAVLPVAFVLLCACSDDPASTNNPPPGEGGAGGGAGGAQGGMGQGGEHLGGGGSGGTPIPEGVPIVVAQGHLARTTISCDGGQSWVADQSSDQGAVCWLPPSNLPDCDHDPGAGRGVAFGDGWFVATFGWGPPGGLRRSADGVSWEETLSGTTFAGVAFGNGVFLAGSNQPQRSDDLGATWEELAPIGLTANARRFGFADVMGGRFVLAGDDDNIAVSSDAGESWLLPTVPAGCGAAIQTEGGIAAGNGAIVVLGGQGNSCVSDDGGETWELFSVGSDISSHLVWTGAVFRAWSYGEMHESSDGRTWSATATVPGDLLLGPTAIDDAGTMVGVRGGWQTWYGEQEFYRSSDGVTWETLPSGSFSGSHPVRAMAFGRGSASATCPGD